MANIRYDDLKDAVSVTVDTFIFTHGDPLKNEIIVDVCGLEVILSVPELYRCVSSQQKFFDYLKTEIRKQLKEQL